jgi:AcrR family transcriptional regulator
MAPRPYRMTKRQELMDSTRTRILGAALEALVGGKGFSIDAVAREAEVTRVTVYDRFGTREALLEATYDYLAETGGLTQLPTAFMQSDPVVALDGFVSIFCGFYSMHRLALRKLNALGVLGQGAEGQTDRNARRLQGLRVLLGRLAEAGYSNADSIQTARTAHALTSFAFIDELAGPDRTPEDVREIIVGLIHQTLGLSAPND